MKRVLVIFAAIAFIGTARVDGQTVQKLPNGNIISKLANGEIWVTIHIDKNPLAIRLTPDMPATGQFRTAIVRNLPPSDIVGAPQSMEIQLLGNCQTKTVQIWGMLPYEGKMRTGLPETKLATGPEGVTRRVKPGSPMAHVFAIVCKQ